MSRLANNLRTDEKILWSVGPIGASFASFIIPNVPFLAFTISCVIIGAANTIEGCLFLLVMFGLMVLAPILYQFLDNRNTEHMITDQRIITRRGAIRPNIRFVDLDQVKEIKVRVGFFDKSHGAGTGTVIAFLPGGQWDSAGEGESVWVRNAVRLRVRQPYAVQELLQQAVENARNKAQAKTFPAPIEMARSPLQVRTFDEAVENIRIDQTGDLSQLSKRLREEEKVVWSGKPYLKAFVLSSSSFWFIPIMVILFALGASLGAPILIALFLPFLVPISFWILGKIISRIISYKNTEYMITDQRIMTQTGAIRLIMRSVELDKIQEIFVNVGYVEKIFGTGTVNIVTVGFHYYRPTFFFVTLKDPNNVHQLLDEIIRGRKMQKPEAQQPRTQAKTATVSSSVVYCGKCGAANPSDSKFCPHCGNIIVDKTKTGVLKRLWGDFKETAREMMDDYYGSEREAIAGELCDHLRRLGLNVAILELDNPESFGYDRLYALGVASVCVKIEGRNIDGILVQVAPPTYLYYYVVKANVYGLESELKATFKSNWHDRCSLKPGFMRVDKSHLEREVSGFHWKGGELAQLLNADSDLVQALYREGLDSLEIKADRDRQCVRILHRHAWRRISKKDMGEGDIVTGYDSDGYATFTFGRKQFPTSEAFEAYDRIAYGIRRIAKANPVNEEEKK